MALHAKAKAEAGFRFYALYDKIYREDVLAHAYAQCRSNKGAPGVDRQDFAEVEAYGVQKWLGELALALRQESYRPAPIRRVFIPKANGKLRPLGISTLRDRVCMTAAMLVLEPIFEADLPPEQYAYRAGRNAQQAVIEVEERLHRGQTDVVDADLADYFGSIPHADLMLSLARRIVDRRVLHLIRMWLECAVEETDNRGRKKRTTEARDSRRGIPQGSPLSPLLSNILLTDWDRELERRGHAFCRYADDCNIYVRSKAAGERLLTGMTTFLAKRLKLKVNDAKSACARPWTRKFLGYSLTVHRQARLRIARESLKRLTARVKTLLRQGRGRSLSHTIETLNPVLRGWVNYFRFTQGKRALEELDGWLRRRLRCLLWRQAKHRQGRTTMLRRQGLREDRAWRSAHNGQGPWWNAGALHMRDAFPKRFFDRQGLVSLLDTQRRLQRS
ncbi:MAG TPA: group II intron reverse transcriptase/maturase [Paraburkholderia sp.]|nr:group II intron reverse transcriptase/maturase [Paraburkholderia sp.]